jgi:hypothetical protein
MIKLRDLLTEGDIIVKNKKTGNVYSVKTFNPAIHDKPTAADIQTAKAKNGGKIPTEKPAPTANIVNKPKDPTATSQNLQKLAQLKQQVAANNDDVDVSDYKTDGEGKVLYKGKKIADYRYNINTDELRLNTKDGIKVFDTHNDMYKYLQKKKEEEPKKQGVLSKMANMFAKKDNGDEPKKPAFGPGGTAGSFGDTTKDDFYNAGETLRQMGWKPDDIAKRIGDNLPYIDDEKDIPQIQDSDDKEDWINLYKKSIAMKKAGYSSSEIADKLRANL